MAPRVLTRQEAQLLHVLLAHSKPITAARLAAQLEVSERTVRSRVKTINELSSPPAIHSGRSGYRVDADAARELLALRPGTDEDAVPQTNVERGAYALKRIIQSGNPINIYDLCEEIYISISTMKAALNKMKRRLADFDLTLKQADGMLSITGTEKNKRRLLSSLLYDEASANFMNLSTIQKAFPNIDVEFIHDCVLTTLEAHRYFVNEYSMVNLVLHIAIAIDRIQSDAKTTATDCEAEGADDS